MENKEICLKCKGKCCKQMGCHYSPDDFQNLTFEGLKKEIDKGYISIDWWQGNPFDESDSDISIKANFLRIRNIYSDIVDPSWGGVCSLLTDNGCKLSYEDRPKGGRVLIPQKNFNCTVGYSKQECAQDWYKYNDILEKLKDYYFWKEDSNDIFANNNYLKDFTLNLLSALYAEDNIKK